MAELIQAPGELALLLHDLECAAYELATGRPTKHDIPNLVSQVTAAKVGNGSSLVAILRNTAPLLDESESARRQFFHAARALLSLYRA